MCGIVGKAGNNVVRDIELLRRMRDTMSHRGPDDAGDWWSEDGTVGLAMRRLSIIDLSPLGHQPMLGGGGKISVVFNGEIYNYTDLKKVLEAKGHTFRTQSDTEVIIEAYREWGTDCVSHLNGMFAIAIYDAERRVLFIARDRAGEKPLFYRHEQGRLWFGSELKSIIEDASVDRTLDHASLELYLTFGYVSGDKCILRGFNKLPPAHAMTYEIGNDRLNVWQYWSLPANAGREAAGENDLLDELEHLLEDAVRRQLVADVPVGIMLSGGVDSSLVTAMASRTSAGKVKTFTVTFPSVGTFNEAPYARLVADHFGTDHTELEAGSVEPLIMADMARQYDEPLADSSMIPTYMVSKLIRRHATVALGGDGGDELFGGYMHYSIILRALRQRKLLPGLLGTAVVAPIRTILPSGFPYRDKVEIALSSDPVNAGRSSTYFDAHGLRRILSGRGGPTTREKDRYSFNMPGDPAGVMSPLRRAQYTDYLNYLPNDVLAKVDRASMLASLEVRAPFLDYRMAELAFGKVPDSMKATENDRKILLKRLARKILPVSLELDRKQGFSIPLGKWFNEGWGKFMTDILLDEGQTLFDRKTISKLASLQYRGIFNYQRLYALTMLELWRREYGISIS